jgi:L-threonylcarbamoyladenylate synthase
MTARILPAGDPASLDEAARILSAGGLVAVPTETVYGLAADATNPKAVAAIYEAKGRPRFNPLISHVDSLGRALSLTALSDKALRLAEAFWPGPLTLAGPRREGAAVADLAAAGLDTLAVRWPASRAMTALIGRLDRPLAAPSANPSGAVSPTTAAHVAEGLGGRIALILDGGPCVVGMESAIVADSPQGLVLLRPGGIAREALEDAAGARLLHPEDGTVQAPGMLTSHYAPGAGVRLDAAAPLPHEVYLAFGPYRGSQGAGVIQLSARGDLVEAASNLFAALREADAMAAAIAVAPIPEAGLGEAINDRLRRAAAPRTARQA